LEVTNLYGDHATITLTDDRGRTVCTFSREKPDSNWCVDDFIPLHNKALKARQRDFAPRRLVRSPDGRPVLEVPGLTLRWENVAPILDQLAAHAVTKISVSQLRDCIR
jgi:hypothetical protein